MVAVVSRVLMMVEDPSQALLVSVHTMLLVFANHFYWVVLRRERGCGHARLVVDIMIDPNLLLV